MIKLITIDLDNTLFDINKNISEENKKALALARAKGVKIVIASGRPFAGVEPTLKELGLLTNDDYAIFYNGAKIMNVGTKEIIYTSSITGGDVKSVYNEAKRLGLDIHAFKMDDELITPQLNKYTGVEEYINHITANVYDFNNIDDNENLIKCLIVGAGENLDKAEKELDFNLKDRFSIVRSARIFLEFLDKKTHKGNALKALAKHLGIDMSETMAIGDGGNDLSMIKYAGIGVAMENAFDYVKDEADFITLDCEHSGVAYAVNKFVNNIKED